MLIYIITADPTLVLESSIETKISILAKEDGKEIDKDQPLILEIRQFLFEIIYDLKS